MLELEQNDFIWKSHQQQQSCKMHRDLQFFGHLSIKLQFEI